MLVVLDEVAEQMTIAIAHFPANVVNKHRPNSPRFHMTKHNKSLDHQLIRIAVKQRQPDSAEQIKFVPQPGNEQLVALGTSQTVQRRVATNNVISAMYFRKHCASESEGTIGRESVLLVSDRQA